MGVKYAILGLLHYGDMHGYRIKELLERDFGYMWTVNFGQIYPALSEMRKDGLVTMARVEQANAPDKKLYSITPEGRAEFQKWLSSAPERNLTIRDPFLLRFTFFGFGDSAHSLDMIDEQIKIYEDQLEARKAHLPIRTRGNNYARLLTELGLGLNETMLEWLRHAKTELAEEAEFEVTKPANAASATAAVKRRR